MQIDQWLPVFDFSAAHHTVVRRSVEVTNAALLRTDFGKPLLVKALMGLRALPAFFTRRPPARGPEAPTATRQLLGLGFTLLEDASPNELVLGLQGQFWRINPGLRRVPAEEFRGPVPAGQARAVWNFSLVPVDGGTELRTETRIACADPETRRRFGVYWTLIGPFSGLLRKAILAHVRREAELHPS